MRLRRTSCSRSYSWVRAQTREASPRATRRHHQDRSAQSSRRGCSARHSGPGPDRAGSRRRALCRVRVGGADHDAPGGDVAALFYRDTVVVGVIWLGQNYSCARRGPPTDPIGVSRRASAAGRSLRTSQEGHRGPAPRHHLTFRCCCRGGTFVDVIGPICDEPWAMGELKLRPSMPPSAECEAPVASGRCMRVHSTGSSTARRPPIDRNHRDAHPTGRC